MEFRKEQSTKLKLKYPDRIPIIITPQDVEITKTKYLAPLDINFSNFMALIKNNVKIRKSEALFCLINGILPTNSQSLAELYNANSHADGFLYVTIRKENVFGTHERLP